MTFSRRIHRLTTVAIVAAYLLGTTFGGVLHDHSHDCEAHGHGAASQTAGHDLGQHDLGQHGLGQHGLGQHGLGQHGLGQHGHAHHSHGHKLAHSAHGHCHQHRADAEKPTNENRSTPLYDDDCGLCRLLGQTALETPTVELATTTEVVATFVESDVAPPSVSLPRLNLSRAPPALG